MAGRLWQFDPMKALLFSALLLPLPAEEIEGTVWYDAQGRVVLVEGPAAEPAPKPFVPGWKKAELAREQRRKDPLRWQRPDRFHRAAWYSAASPGYRAWGWGVRPMRPAAGRACFRWPRRGTSVVIRW